MNRTMRRWSGLQALVQEAVEHGSRAVERVQLQTASRPFAVLERIPVVAPAAKMVHAAHDVSVIGTHALIRAANELAGTALAAALAAGGEGWRKR